MKIAYFDCFAGVSGDMVLGAMLNAGLNLEQLTEELQKLNLQDYSIGQKTVLKNGISATKCDINITEQHKHRHYGDIIQIIESSSLSAYVKESSKNIFYVIAVAEAKIHNTTLEKVHFHEVGALDSILDIVGAAIGLEQLGIDEIFCSSIHVGSGFVNSQHGTIPVPAPATMEILKGVPVFSRGIPNELTTPTGAAIVKALSKEFGSLPPMEVTVSGYGAGSRDLEIPNALRIVIGESVTKTTLREEIYSLETNIDDMNPEIYSYLFELLFAEGAFDVFTLPINMKKNRPATCLTVLCGNSCKQRLVDIILKETTSAGVRITIHDRIKQQRRLEKIETCYGTVTVKLLGDVKNGLTISPEYEECRIIAHDKKVPIKDVFSEVQIKAHKEFGS